MAMDSRKVGRSVRLVICVVMFICLILTSLYAVHLSASKHVLDQLVRAEAYATDFSKEGLEPEQARPLLEKLGFRPDSTCTSSECWFWNESVRTGFIEMTGVDVIYRKGNSPTWTTRVFAYEG
jgi:hypothetical protein